VYGSTGVKLARVGSQQNLGRKRPGKLQVAISFAELGLSGVSCVEHGIERTAGSEVALSGPVRLQGARKSALLGR
jgi:hypothetical protein